VLTQSCLEFVSHVYSLFGLQPSLRLSTRPEKFIGDPAVWNQAEQALAVVLNATGKKWERNQGDGAFYGPKVDISVRDALGREHQCATVQLDFQLPLRFELRFRGADGKEHVPVMIHRAILVRGCALGAACRCDGSRSHSRALSGFHRALSLSLSRARAGKHRAVHGTADRASER
jgi:threonyl-tRNA synthetase